MLSYLVMRLSPTKLWPPERSLAVFPILQWSLHIINTDHIKENNEWGNVGIESHPSVRRMNGRVDFVLYLEE